MIRTSRIRVATNGQDDMVDLTPKIEQVLRSEGVSEALMTAFVVGSTAALSTIEYEPGLQRDMPVALERVAPVDAVYEHEEKWHDDNGHSHIRASLVGPSLSVPVSGGRLTLGEWQQIVLLEFDTRPRERQVVIQLIDG